MGLIIVSGEAGCRHDAIARLAANHLGFELITEPKLREMLAEEFGSEAAIPDKAWMPAVTSILARLAVEHHLVVSAPGTEQLFPHFPGILRVRIVAPESQRVGYLMLDHQMERQEARQLLRQLDAQERATRKGRTGRATASAHQFDLILNSELFDTDRMHLLVAAAAEARGMIEQGLVSPAAEAQIQFQVRLQLAKHGLQPADRVNIKPHAFMHPSEETFANLLDFYRISWEYEPRSFPVQWAKDGSVLESFTPDFYLPEFDLYVELTTMKQSLVTKKNRKVKLLRSIYPHLNIQVFYQKDLQDLVCKHGLVPREVTA